MTNIKVIEKTGNEKGKTTVILAGIHGNETCGIKAFDKIIPTLQIDSGKVIFIYSNLEAIKQNKRFIEKNLNRCFLKDQPKEIFESIEGKTALEIIPYLDSCDFSLDLHSSSNPLSVPFLICDEKQLKNAPNFETEIVSYNWDSFEIGSTDHYMNKLNKPGFCYECGYSNNEKSIETAINAIMNFLKFTGNIKGKVNKRTDQRFMKIKAVYINKMFAFKKAVCLQDFGKITKDMIVGYEGNQPVFAKKDDILVFLTDRNYINQECFLTAIEVKKETLINNNNLNKMKEDN